MKKFNFILILIVFSAFLFASTDVFYGPVSGTWDVAGSPYLIHAEINIPTNQSLTIQPGVEIIFQGCYRFIVNGRLLAQGTATDSIFFTAANQYTGWKGIRFINTTYNGQPGSVLNYCHFEHGKQMDNGTAETKGGVLLCLNASNLLIQHSLFSNNEARYGGAIAIINSSPNLQNLIVKNNNAISDGGGMYISSSSCPVISNSHIINNECYCDGGGIFISGNSNPTLENCIISQNEAGYEYDCGGGGVVVWSAQATFENCLFAGNHSTNNGGALWIVLYSQVQLNNSIITRNSANNGAGIYCTNSDLDLAGTSIHRNISQNSPSGIYSYEGNFVFDQNNRSSIYMNLVSDESDQGHEIRIGNQNYAEVYLDTFTVAVPTEHYASPLANFTFDIQNHIFESTASNLYVSIIGSNTNSGLTPTEPIKSIFQAVQMIQPDSQNPLIIFVEDGTYSPSNTEEVFPFNLKSYLTIQGTSKLNTIIDAENSGNMMILNNLNEVNLNDLTLSNGYESGYSFAGGIDSFSSDLSVSNLTIRNCHSVSYAGAISLSGTSTLYLAGTSIFQNTSGGEAGAISKGFGSPTIEFDPINLCNIYLNTSYLGYEIFWYYFPIHVIVDTFTVLNPDGSNVFPLNQFTFDINQAIYEPVAADLYVSPNGSNSNSGLSSAEPLKTIQRALQKIISTEIEPHTIYLADGIYSPSTNGEIFPLSIVSYTTISGASRNGTIINAEETNQVIAISGDYVRLEYFTVTNGFDSYGAGIYITGSDAELFELTIKDNSAVHNSLYYNYGFGGGIYANSDNAIFQNLLICDNFALNDGGGVFFYNPVNLKNVTIKDNVAGDLGGGFYCEETDIVFDEILRSNIYNNLCYALPNIGNDIYFLYDESVSVDMHVNVDTFTVQYPNNYFAYPTEHLIFDIQNYILPSIVADVYVSPEDSNSNSGLTADDPFRSLSYALQRIAPDSLNQLTIHLLPGTYSPVINGEFFPLPAQSYITIQGESKETTILDGNAETYIFLLRNLTDFAINDCTMRNCMGGLGGAIYANNSQLNLSCLNICQNHSSSFGGAIYAIDSDLNISDSYLYFNSASYGGAIYAVNSQLTLLNNTICFNEAPNNGAVYYRTSNQQGEDQTAILVNQILWGNEPDQIYLRGTNTYTATMIIDHSDIEAGQAGVQYQGNYNLHWLDGNINAYPMFGEIENDFFMLQPESPCIDTGTAFFEWENQVYLDMQPDEYLGPAPDIGAWESEFTGSDIPHAPLSFGLQQNFPNPFNPDTKIQFSIPMECKVELIIYNIKGQKVKQLVSDQLAVGQHSIVWNGKDENGKQSSSGIYFYRVKANVNGKTRFEKTRKMMLLK